MSELKLDTAGRPGAGAPPDREGRPDRPLEAGERKEDLVHDQGKHRH